MNAALGTRRWAVAEAMAIGRGGISAVSKATGLSRVTIRKGKVELSSDSPLPDRQRRPGAGRKTREAEQPSLVEALEKSVDSGTRGDPESPLRWTIKSTRSITRELRRQNFSVGSTKVGVETHDFPRKELGKAVPYGVYDLQNNEGFVSVGNG